MVALRVGLDVMLIGRGYEEAKEPAIVGEDAAELTVEAGIEMGMAIGNRVLGRMLSGEPMLPCSLRCDMEGETARRLAEEG